MFRLLAHSSYQEHSWDNPTRQRQTYSIPYRYRKHEAQHRRHRPNTDTRMSGFRRAPRGGGRTQPASSSHEPRTGAHPPKLPIAIATIFLRRGRIARNPDPPIFACFFLLKKGRNPRKIQGYSSLPNPENFGKKGKCTKKTRNIAKRKKQGKRRKQGLEGQGYSAERAIVARKSQNHIATAGDGNSHL